MSLTRSCYSIACAAILSLVASTTFAQTWVEMGDAPQDLADRQDTKGVGPLTSISGSTSATAGDYVDVYSIMITDPAAFYATTEETWGSQLGSASFDTRLFLFAADGSPMVANDDIVGGPNWRSLVSDPSTFPTTGDNGVAASAANIVLTPGKYLLAVTGYQNDPADAAGAILFSDTGSISDSNLHLHGPNPAAGAFAAWENPAGAVETGTYVVALGGATFCAVPEPATLCLAAAGLMGLLALRRRMA